MATIMVHLASCSKSDDLHTVSFGLISCVEAIDQKDRERVVKDLGKKSKHRRARRMSSDTADNLYLHNTLKWKSQDMFGLLSI